MFKLSIAALAAAASMLAAAPAMAGVVLDQSDIPETGHFDFSGGAGMQIGTNGISQSFTVGVTGVLDHVALDVAEWNIDRAAAGLRFQLQDAALNTLFTHDFAVADIPVFGFSGFNWEDVLNVDVRAANVAVQAGQQFVLRVNSLDNADSALVWRTGYSGQTISYSGGSMTSYDFPPGFPGPITGGDAAFRTYVDVAGVPEPATWGLLIMGFAGVGGAIRRRRTTALA